MTRANPSCSNFGMANELRGVEKKSGESFPTFSASVPRPAFEIIKVGKNAGKKKSAEKHSNPTIFQAFTIRLNFNLG